MSNPDRLIPVVPAVRGSVTAPPSKSHTQRALIIASLAPGRSRLLRPLLADDPLVLIKALQVVGIPVRVGRSGEGVVEVDGDTGAPRGGSGTLSVDNAGTAMRFLTARLALSRGVFLIDGDRRMRVRPIGDLLRALRALGAAAESVGGNDCPPVRVGGRGMTGGRARLSGEKSSQYLSAILMAAPAAAETVVVELEGRLVSRPYVDLTIAVMRRFGVDVVEKPPGPQARRFVVTAGQRYRPGEVTIEGDYSSASYFFAAAAMTGGLVRVEGLDPASAQGDARFLALLQRMGCWVERGEGSVTVEGAKDLRGVDADLGDLPDTAPSLAVVALFARDATRITGVGHLRLKESDRIAALVSEIRRLGGEATPSPDGLTVIPRPLTGGRVATHGDHRMAMAFAVAGLRVPGISIQDPGCVAKSFPDFWDALDRLIASSI